MKKHAGFTLIELIIGIAIMLIIFGGIVYIFGASTKSAQAGMNHKQAYEAGRQIMDEIKTTMRYADTITPGTDSITYSVSSDYPVYQEHWADDLTKGKSRYYSYTISWKDSNKKQIKIEKSITQVDPETKAATKVSLTSPVYYPSDDNLSANGAFDSTEYKDACDKMSDTSLFPIMTNEFSSDVSLYRILIPFKYKDGSGTNKVEVLQTEVTPTDYSSQTSTSATDRAMTLIKAATLMYGANEDSIANGKSDFANIVSGSQASAKKVGTSRNNLDAFLQANEVNGYQGKLTDLESHSWIIVPTKKGNVVKSWTLYVAKNVIDDLDGINESYGTDYNGLTAALKKLAENKAEYIIRGNTGFLCYQYFSDGMTGNLLKDSNGTIIENLGYVTGYRPSADTVVRAINPDEWLPFTYKDSNGNVFSNYTNLMDSKNKYSDDHTDNNGKISTGTYKRIDYSQKDGAEYTQATCKAAGTKYEYPYGKKTGADNPS